MVKKKGFTLIELVAVLVIMAIITLIVTPLVMSIIRKARISADKRSIDAYGRSIELAISSHLLDTGKFATSIEQLTIEYSGDKVECETTQINPDSSIFLSNCKVNNREVTNYTYGTDKSPSYAAYSVGDEVTYNGVDYYVLKDSGTKDNVVTLLKAEPLSYEEVQIYSSGTGANTSNQNDYGGMQYGTTSDYSPSYVKQVVDAWATDKVPGEIITLRLLTYDELIMNFGYNNSQKSCVGGGCFHAKNDSVPIWIYNSQYKYWTMTGDYKLWNVYSNGDIYDDAFPSMSTYTVRPVVELYKNDGITRKNSSNN